MIRKVIIWQGGEFDNFSNPDWPPDKATEFMAWFQSKLDMIPDEYKELTMIDLTNSTSYDSSKMEIEIYYERAETPEEETERERQAQAQIEHKRQQEIELLERLKKKYGA